MKSKKTLYKIVLKQFIKGEDRFICSTINSLVRLGKVTKLEFEYISLDFNNNQPTDELHSEFINDSWIGSYAWWHEDKETRIAFLTKLIEINS